MGIFQKSKSWNDSYGDRLQKLRFSQNDRERIHVFESLSDNVVYTHYKRGVGTFVCKSTPGHTAACCELLGEKPRAKFMCIALKYVTKKDGSLRANPIDEGEVYLWGIPLRKRNQIQAAKGTASLDQIDLEISCQEEKLQDLMINRAEGSSVLLDPKFKDDAKEALKKAKEMYNDLETKSGINDWSEEIIRTKLAGAPLDSEQDSFTASADTVEEVSTSTKAAAVVEQTTASDSYEEASEVDLEAFLDD